MAKVDNGDIHSLLGLLVRIVRKWSATIPQPDAPAVDFKVFATELMPLLTEAFEHPDVLHAIVRQRFFADGRHSAIYRDEESDPPLYAEQKGAQQ